MNIPLITNSVWTDDDITKTRAFFESVTGHRFLQNLKNSRPPPACFPQPHYVNHRNGEIAGYEQCERNLISLGAFKPKAKEAPEANYGVEKVVPTEAV